MPPDDMSAEPQNIADYRAEQERRRGGGGSALVRGLEFSDKGNGERFSAQHGENVRYVEDLGKQKWLVWTPEGADAAIADSRFQIPDDDLNPENYEAVQEPRFIGFDQPSTAIAHSDAVKPATVERIYGGGFWRMDRTGEVMRLAKITCESIRDEEKPASAGPEFTENRAKHYARTQERKGLVSMLALAQSEHPIPATPEEFDLDPRLLNCTNGTLEFRDGKPMFRAARREDLLTKRIPWPFIPGAIAPTWIQSIKRWMGHKEACEVKDEAERTKALEACEALCKFLARAVGLSLTGIINDRAVFILYGSGANGKTIFIETIRSLLGADFSTVMPVEALMAGKMQSSIPTDIADLRGKRFAIASETNEGDRPSMAKLKRLTGSDMLTGRQLYGQKFDFSPTHHLWLATNHKPSMRGATKAVFDRLKLVPFKVRIPETEQVPSEELKQMLRAEMPGILNWALDGYVDWEANGLSAPAEVRDETTKWEHEDDLLSHFLEDCTERIGGVEEPKGSMYRAWVSYCEERKERHGSDTQFSRWMKEHEIEEGRTGPKGRFWKNIRLVSGVAATSRVPTSESAREQSERTRSENPDFWETTPEWR